MWHLVIGTITTAFLSRDLEPYLQYRWLFVIELQGRMRPNVDRALDCTNSLRSLGMVMQVTSNFDTRQDRVTVTCHMSLLTWHVSLITYVHIANFMLSANFDDLSRCDRLDQKCRIFDEIIDDISQKSTINTANIVFCKMHQLTLVKLCVLSTMWKPTRNCVYFRR